MNAPFFKPVQDEMGWHVLFAFQVFHRPPEEWMKMKWGFNAGALLDEALDRYKLFIESQSINEVEFMMGVAQNNTLVLRGVYSPDTGVRMVLLGKSCAEGREQALENAHHFARQVSSTFPHDFILVPAKQENHDSLAGEELLDGKVRMAQIQRGIVPLPKGSRISWLTGLWRSAPRSNEQIWRALSAMPQPALFNILVKPVIMYPEEKSIWEDVRKEVSVHKEGAGSERATWLEACLSRRLSIWKKFFLAQVHVVTASGLENLIHAIGPSLTRDSSDLALPSYQARYSTTEESHWWGKSIRLLELVESSSRMDDLADTDEIFSIFRFPYRPETGLPGAKFEERPTEKIVPRADETGA
jgi:hypothetical protein